MFWHSMDRPIICEYLDDARGNLVPRGHIPFSEGDATLITAVAFSMRVQKLLLNLDSCMYWCKYQTGTGVSGSNFWFCPESFRLSVTCLKMLKGWNDELVNFPASNPVDVTNIIIQLHSKCKYCSWGG